MTKWIYPAIGDLPLALVDNIAVKPLVEKMCKSGLSARTVNKYVEYIKQVVKSLKAPNGEPVHKRTWDADTMDLPVVNYSEQKRPSLKANTVSRLIAESSGEEQALYVLLAATGMRISEVLAVETGHFINEGRTIKVEQQVEKNHPRIVQVSQDQCCEARDRPAPGCCRLPGTLQGREVRVVVLNRGRNTASLPLAHATPRQDGIGRERHGLALVQRLRGARCLEDLNNFWMAHKPQTMSEVCSHLHEELPMRLDEAKRVGFGFELPVIAPSAPGILEEIPVEIAA